MRDYSKTVFRGNTPAMRVIDTPTGDRRLASVRDAVKIKQVATLQQICDFTAMEQAIALPYLKTLETEGIIKKGKLKGEVAWKYLK